MQALSIIPCVLELFPYHGWCGTFSLLVKFSLCEMFGKVQKEIPGPENHESCTEQPGLTGEIPVWQHCLSAGHPSQALDSLPGPGGCGTTVKVKHGLHSITSPRLAG